MEFPTIDKFAKEVAEKALDEITYEGKTVREWVEILVNQQPCEDCISREEIRKVLSNEVFALMKLHTVNPEDNPKADAMAHGVNWSLNTLMELPSVTPQPKVGKWIPVTERLPETRDEVLISLADGRITIASYNDHFLPFFNKPIGWGVDAKRFVLDFCSDDVIAWMPLPEPYKAESEE